MTIILILSKTLTARTRKKTRKLCMRRLKNKEEHEVLAGKTRRWI